MPETEFMTVAEIAAILKITEQTVRIGSMTGSSRPTGSAGG
jgi:predicted transcriptional regulator